MRKLLAAAAFLALSVFWACHLAPEDNQDHFDLIGDSSWTSCDSVLVVLLDSKGKELDTLFKGKLESLSQLKNLSAAKYDGSSATLRIRGSNEDGACFEEERSFEGDGQSLKVDTIKSLTALPLEVVLDPESLSVSLDGSPVPVRASILPAYADQTVTFTVVADGALGAVSLAPAGGDGNLVKIKPEKIGNAAIRVSSVKDPSRTAVLKIRVLPPSGNKVTLDKDSVLLYLGGAGQTLVAAVEPASVDQAVTWRSMNPDVVTVDSAGRIKAVAVGETYVNAKSIATGESRSGLVIVKRDIPVLTVASKSGAPVNSRIVFSPHSSQKHGSILMYKWDLDGDGNWDDSSSVPGIGPEVDLQSQSASYAKEGLYTARFYVRDSEGNDATAEVQVDIGNQAPEVTAIRYDTVISIKDSIAMTASARDVDGKVVWYGWDYDGNGVFDDSAASSDSSVEVAMGHRYPDAGLQLAIFKAKDETGKTRLDTVKVKVELDRPVADAGEDVTVTVGAAVPLHLDGTDKFGKIEKREVRFHGSGTGFHELSKPDTTITAPAEPGTYLVVLKVTDDDDLIDVDSMYVNVILSANADLAGLAFSAGALVPAFKPAIQFFSGHADFADSSVTVTPTAKDPSSTISVNAKPVASGSASSPVKLAVGPNINVFQIVVTAADGTQRVYQISVDRDPSADATLSKLDVSGFILKPAFAGNTVEYADTVAAGTASITLKPTLAVSTASLTVNDSAMASGTATFPMPLKIGENVFKIAVTSQSGTAKTVYQIKVHRRAQLVALRSLGGKPATQTDSTEVLAGSPRPILSAPVTGYRFVKWSVLEGVAVIANADTNPTALTLNSAKVRVLAEFAINKYNISAGANTGGGISPSGSISVDHGSDAVFALTVNPGFRLKALTVDGVDAASGVVAGSYSFKNVMADHSISAAFVKVDTLTTKFPTPGGKIAAAKIVVDNGTDTAFYVTTDAGYAVKTFLDNGVDKLARIGAGGRYPIKADGNHLVEATWVRGFPLTAVADPVAGGDINPKAVSVEEGASQVFDITVNPGYRIKILLDNGADSTKFISPANKYTIAKIDTVHNLGVVFQRVYNITVTATGPGTVSGTAGLVDEGESRSYTLNYGKSVRVRSLKVDGSASNLTTIDFKNITSNHSIEVEFVNLYSISTVWSAGGINNAGGTISPVNPILEAGESPTFTVTPALVGPNSGYRLDSTVVDGIKDASPRTSIQFTNLASGHSIVAGFKRYFYIENSAGAGGTISPANAKVDTLGTQLISYSAAPGYRFLRLLDNGTPVAGATATSYTLGAGTGGIKSDHVMKAEFIRQFTVTETHTGIGKIDIPKPLIDADSSQVITIVPKAGYKLTQVKDNGVIKAIQDPYKGTSFPINKISENHVLEVTFTAYYTLTPVVGSTKYGSVSPASLEVDSGGSAFFTISPNPNWIVKYVTDKTAGASTDIPAVVSFQIGKVIEAHDLTIVFSEGATLPISMTAVSENKEEWVSSNLCVMVGKERNCGGTPYVVNVPEGTIFNLYGEDGFILNSIGFREDASVATWGQVSRLNETIFSELNPTKELKPEAGVSYRAHYVPGIIR
jgi:hypothetical protein